MYPSRPCPTAVFLKLVAIFVVVALGWVAGKLRWLGDNDPARTLSNAAFYIFIPALLFRTTARVDFATLPWGTLAAFFVPVLLLLVVVYAWQRRWNRSGRLPAAAPSVRAISATFGNTLQIGVPMMAALFGEAGLAIHITIISLHALTLLTVLTALVELDLARERRQLGHAERAPAAHRSARRRATPSSIRWCCRCWPAWSGTRCCRRCRRSSTRSLLTMSQAVVPLCLVLIGMSLAYYGMRGAAKRRGGAVGAEAAGAAGRGAGRSAHWGMGLDGLPLAVVVMAASLPIGSQRADLLAALRDAGGRSDRRDRRSRPSRLS